MVAADDLVGAAEIADRAGLKQRQTVHLWRRRYESFPAPVAELHGGLIWDWSDVADWLERSGRIAPKTGD